MLSKLLSKIKTTPMPAQNPAEAAALESISTVEKAEALQTRLKAAQDACDHSMPVRRNLLRRQSEQVDLAIRRLQIEHERDRVASVMQRDKARYDEDLKRAEDDLARADVELKTRQDQHGAVADRLKPIEAALAQIAVDAAARVEAAQRAFNAAVVQGDEAAETAAAEALIQAKNESNSGTDVKSGALRLRLEAIRREEAEAGDAVGAATQALQAAQAAILQAKAELAVLEYDRQAQALLNAYIAQHNAVAACGSSLVGSRHRVETPEISIGSVERIMFSDRTSDYNKKRMPLYMVHGLANSMAAAPDLSVLAANADDVVEPPPEPLDSRSEPLSAADALDSALHGEAQTEAA